MRIKNKKGINLIALLLMITISLIIVTAITVSVGNNMKQANLAKFTNEISQVQEALRAYYISTNELPTTGEFSKDSLKDIVENASVFSKELLLNGDQDAKLYKLDLAKMEIDGDTSDLDYIYSYPNLNIYNLNGFKQDDDIFYSISSRISKIENTENETENASDLSSKLQISGGALLSVTSNNNVNTNRLGIQIQSIKASDEELIIYFSGVGEGKKVNNDVSVINFDTLDDLNALGVLQNNLLDSEIEAFNNSEEKIITVIISKNNEEIAKEICEVSNYDIVSPMLEFDSEKVYDNMKVLRFNVNDLGSGLKELRYDYLKKFNNSGGVVNYYENVNSFDEMYMKTKAKVITSEQLINNQVELKIPNEIASVYVVAVDNAGNISNIIPFSYTLDLLCTVTADKTSPTASDTITYTFTFSKNVIGFEPEDIIIENGIKGKFSGSGKVYKLVVTGGVSGTQKISVPKNVCTDGSGNSNSAVSKTITIDKVAPTISTIAVTSPIDGTYKSGKILTIKVTYSKNVYANVYKGTITASNAPYLEIKFGTGLTRGATFSSANQNQIIYTYTLQDGDNGEISTVSYSGKVYDTLGNELRVNNIKIGGYVITADTQAPQVTSVEQDITELTSKDVKLTIKFKDNISGTSGYQLSTDPNLIVSSTGWEITSATTDEITKEYTITQNGTYYFYVKDKVGNISKKQIDISNIDKTEYTITYDLAGGTLDVNNPSTYTVDTATFTLHNPTKTGYIFAGWIGTGLSEPTDTVIIEKGSSGNREYTANWKPEVYTVTYDLTDGELPSGADNPTEYTIESDDIELVKPNKTGYTFIGWTGTDLSSPTQNVIIPKGSVGDRTYTATWAESQGNAVAYNENTEVYYTDLQTAVDEAGIGEKVRLLKNIDTATTININLEFILDTNGYVITNTSENASTIPILKTAGEMIIEGNGAISNPVGVAINNTRNLELKNIYIYSDGGNGCITNTGSLIINSGTYIDSSNVTGVDNLGQLTMNAGTIDANIGIYSAGNSTCLINNGNIIGINEGIYAIGNAIVEIKGGAVTSSSADAIYLFEADLVFGDDSNEVSKQSPQATSKNGYGLYNDTGALVSFYDGIINGTTLAIYDNINYVPTNYEIVYSNSGKTATLELIGNIVAKNITMLPNQAYTNLQTAIDEANTNHTIQLQKQLSLTETITVASGKNIVLDFNDFTISNHVNDYAVINEGTLDLVDNGGDVKCGIETGKGIKNTGTLTLTSSSQTVTSGYGIYNTGTVNVNNSIQATTSYGIYNTGTVNVNNGGSITGTMGIHSQGKTITLSDGGSVTGTNGYGISLWSGDLNMSGGNVTGNTGVLLYDISKAVITGGSITGNISYGIELFDDSGESLTLGINSSEVPSTTSPVITGAVYGVKSYSTLNNSKFNFYDGKIVTISDITGPIYGMVSNVPDGYGIVYSTDGKEATLGSITDMVVENVNKKSIYSNLQTAIDVAEDNDELKILKDITELTESIENTSKILTLNTNGKNISSSLENTYTLSNSGTLTITGAGTISNDVYIALSNTGTINLENAIISGADNDMYKAGIINNSSVATLNMTEGEVSGGCGIFLDYGNMHMSGGKVISLVYNAIDVKNADVIITDSAQINGVHGIEFDVQNKDYTFTLGTNDGIVNETPIIDVEKSALCNASYVTFNVYDCYIRGNGPEDTYWSAIENSVPDDTPEGYKLVGTRDEGEYEVFTLKEVGPDLGDVEPQIGEYIEYRPIGGTLSIPSSESGFKRNDLEEQIIDVPDTLTCVVLNETSTLSSDYIDIVPAFYFNELALGAVRGCVYGSQIMSDILKLYESNLAADVTTFSKSMLEGQTGQNLLGLVNNGLWKDYHIDYPCFEAGTDDDYDRDTYNTIMDPDNYGNPYTGSNPENVGYSFYRDHWEGRAIDEILNGVYIWTNDMIKNEYDSSNSRDRYRNGFYAANLVNDNVNISFYNLYGNQIWYDQDIDSITAYGNTTVISFFFIPVIRIPKTASIVKDTSDNLGTANNPYTLIMTDVN